MAMNTLKRGLSLPRKNAGITLIEVLVTLIIMAIGLLGLAALQMNSLRQNVAAYERSVASMLAYEIIDRMHANFGNGALYATGFDDAPPTTVDCQNAGANCTAAQMAAFDMATWKCNLGGWDDDASCTDLGLGGVLPEGDGEITVNGTRVMVSIRWVENRNATAEEGRLTTLSISTELGSN